MSGMPTEAAIKEAILRLKPAPGKFQELAESFMRIQRGDAYRNLVPQGRNTRSQTTIGYPDAYGQDDAQGLYLIETTTGNWRTHLDSEDLLGIHKIIKDGNRVAEFTLFTMTEKEILVRQNRKRVAKPKKTIEEYRSDIEALGVPSARIRFIFLDQLVAELQQPAYLRVLFDIGLPIDITPFYSIDLRVLSDARGPIKEEFNSCTVVAEDLLQRIQECLKSSPLMLIEGGSGLGKTTLATAFGFQWQRQPGCGAYYMDMSDYPDPAAICPQLIQLIKIFGDAQHLFILDNCHRIKPELLKQVLNAHVDANNRPAILAVARKQNDADIATLCWDLNVARMLLRLRAEDLRAVYLLMVRRNFPNGAPEPSAADFKAWLGLYADLVSFSLALAGAEDSLRSGVVPKLRERDAIDYLRTHYTDELPQDEREVLAVIAHCARFEFPASRLSLQGRIPKVSLKLGWVFEQRAKNQELRYGLAHPMIGALVLKALEKQEDDAWESAIKEDFFQACYLVQQLLPNSSEGVVSDEVLSRARSVLERVSVDAWTFSDRFSPGYSGAIASLFRRVGLEKNFRVRLNSQISTYVANQERFLIGLPSFLAFAEREGFTEEVTQVWVALQKAAKAGRMEMAARLAPVGTLHNLIRMASKQGPKELAWLVDSISTEGIAASMANKFGKLKADLAEEVLRDLNVLVPKLYGRLIRLLRNGPALDSFRTAMADAFKRSDIRAWMRRPLLLRLLADEGAPLLSAEWLSRRSIAVLHLLLTDPEIKRCEFESLAQGLIKNRITAIKMAKNQEPLTGNEFFVMVCMADASSAKLVDAYINSLSSKELLDWLEQLETRDIGSMLLGAVSEFGQKPSFQALRVAALEVVRLRMERAFVMKRGAPPGRLFVAMHIAISQIAGVTDKGGWLEQAIALIRMAPPLKDLRDKTDSGSKLHHAYWACVERVFVDPVPHSGLS
ncbi:hypothetical protein [Rhodanobacter sp. A1T4]|uniref:hypothetical protein n=1 Tax=Rhodanobacter sp. A1T4 TaxID=2723087 RepID=UPI00161A56E4|nr:hypothetical protein [Rhodanobacter sp. A1T4]MBB6249164.1 hypothetical protein [Rhodanobacter sp. A1T4]